MKAPVWEREDAGLWVSSRLVDPDFARALPTTDEGRNRIIVASASDPIKKVSDRIDLGPKPVTLCVELGDYGMVLAVWRDKETTASDDVHEIAPDATLGFFLSYLIARGAPVAFDIKEPVQLKFELAYPEKADPKKVPA